MKMGGKVAHSRPTKKKEETKNLMMIYDRPISAKGAEDRRKASKYGGHSNAIADKLGGHEMLVTNSSKKRYPSTTIREDPFKWK